MARHNTEEKSKIIKVFKQIIFCINSEKNKVANLYIALCSTQKSENYQY